ncbi:MAG: type IV pilus biogenesis/stability protein PilW [Gammaproteobacteria bacterium]|nr:type IV pilus biogenesis/stability protein PilW [Gammaproteobacteria bacterium]
MKQGFILRVILPILLLTGCTTVSQIDSDRLSEASDANAQLGLAYMQQGRYELSLLKLNKAVEQDPENADVHYYMAELYRRLDRPKQAEVHFLEALRILPKTELSSQVAAVRNNYAVFLCEHKRFDEAKKYFDMVSNEPLYQERDHLLENMGLCERDKGNLHQAEVFLLKALRENPKLSKSLLAMAQINFDKRQYRQSDIYFSKFLANSSHTAQSLWLALLMERRKGNKDKVANYAVRLKSRYPDSKETRLLQSLEAQEKL